MTPLQRAALTVAVLAHLVLVGSVVSQPLDRGVPPTTRRFLTAALSFDSTHWPGPGGDFFALYHAGVQVRAGRSPHDLTEPAHQTPYYFRYIYSPVLAETLGRAVTVFPARAAYLVWVGVIEICLAAWVFALWRSGATSGGRAAATIILLINQPYALELHMGQFTFVAVSLTLLGAVALVRVGTRPASRAHVTLAPLLFAAATALKTFPVVAVAALLRIRRARPALLAIAIVLAAIVLASIHEPAGPFSLGSADLVGVPHPGAESLPQAVFVVFLAATSVWLPTAIPLLPGAIVALVLLVSGVVVVRRGYDATTGAALMLLAFFLSYFHAWEHHYSAAILAGSALILPGAGLTPPDRRRLLICLALLALPTPYALIPRDVPVWTVGDWLVMSLSKSLPLLYAFAIGLRARPARPVSQPA